MSSNVVEILIGAKDDAKLDLDSLRQRLDDLAHKVSEAKVKIAGDKEAEVALDRLGAKLIRFGHRTDNAKIGLEGQFKVMAELGAVDLALDEVRKKADGAGSGGGLLGSFRNLASNGVTALGNLATTGTALLNPITALLSALAVIIAGPLLAALLPVTAGFAAFAATAVPEITKVWDAVSKGGAALKKLSPDERAMAGPIESLKDQFGKLAKAVQPEIIKALGSALRVIKDVLPALTPLAAAAGKAIDGFLKNIDNWLKSDSGKKFLKWMETDGPNAIKKFGQVMWDVAQGVGHVFDFLKNAGETWWKNVHDVISHVEHGWDGLRTYFDVVKSGIITSYHDLENATDTVRETFVRVGHDIESVFNGIKTTISGAVSFIIGQVHNLESVLGGINSHLGGIPGKVLGHLGLAAGGIAGAASGGLHSGLRMVGERGPELVQLPPGSRVYNNEQSRRMVAQGGGPVQVVLHFGGTGRGELDRAFMNWIQDTVRVVGGGDVQVAFGAA